MVKYMLFGSQLFIIILLPVNYSCFKLSGGRSGSITRIFYLLSLPKKPTNTIIKPAMETVIPSIEIGVSNVVIKPVPNRIIAILTASAS